MILRELADAVDAGRPVASATVVRTHRSVPRHAGSRMLVYADGSTSGTIGGGAMEQRVVEAALAALADGTPRLSRYTLLDPADGDPGVCGGEVDIYVEPHMPAPVLFVVGAGHVGRAVEELAQWLGNRTSVWDDRPGLLDELAAADATHGGSIEDAITAAGVEPDTAIVVVTRDVELDVTILPPLLATPAGYIGLMGSRRRWATTRERLRAAGLGDELLDRVHSPIGVDIDAETPEEIAVSVLAEVIAHRGRRFGE